MKIYLFKFLTRVKLIVNKKKYFTFLYSCYRTYFECRESVRRDIERRDLDISEEVVKVIRVDHDLGQSFVSRALSQHCATVKCDVLVLVTARQECIQ